MPKKATTLFLGGVALAVTFAVYAPTLRYQFVYDDHGQILNSEYALHWSSLPTFFSRHLWSYKKLAAPVYYRPMFLVWFTLNHELFGINPWWWHLSTISLHLLATFLVYRLGVRLFADPVLAAFAAVLFGIHPTHIESVAWVSGVSDPLLAVFFLGAIVSYLRARDPAEPRRNWWMAGSLAAASLALLAKETAVILPCLILATELLVNQRKSTANLRAAFTRTLPYVAIVLIYLCFRVIVLRTIATTLNPISLWSMTATWPEVFNFYLQHLLYPVGLSISYDIPYVTHLGIRHFWLPLLVLAVVTANVIFWARSSRLAGFAALLIALPLLPVVDLRAYVVDEVVHDRYLYLSCAGLALLVVDAAQTLRSQVRTAILSSLVLILGMVSLQELKPWRDDITLFSRASAVAPDNRLAQQNMGIALLMSQRYREAIPFFEKVVARGIYTDASLYGLGRCYFAVGRYSQAEPCFRGSIEANPLEPNPYFYLGLTFLRQGRLDEAEGMIREALKRRPMASPEYQLYHLFLAETLEEKHDLPGALAEYEQELQENPASPTARERRDLLRKTLARR